MRVASDGSRLYTPNFSSGQLWERMDLQYFGVDHPDRQGAVLWFLVFFDDTCVVQRGTTSAKPIMVTLGNFPAEIRTKPVSLYVY